MRESYSPSISGLNNETSNDPEARGNNGATGGTQAPSLLQALHLAPKILRRVLECEEGQRKWQNDSFSVRPSRRLKYPEQLDSYTDGVLLAGGLCG